MSFIEKEDYEEPRCPLSNPTRKVFPIDVSRMLRKLDEYFDANDMNSAEKHLIFWLEEAKNGNDDRGKLTVLNELVGIYRKTRQEDKGMKAVEEALSCAEELHIEDSVSMGTTLVNCATALKSFGKTQEALPMYEKAKEIYENNLSHDDGRLSGLYNNMALSVMETGDFKRAKILFEKALLILSNIKNGELEQGITYCNLADMIAMEMGTEQGEEKIGEYLKKAMECLNAPEIPKNGYYAFVCDKCSGTFGYYGYFAYENELKKRAEKIYERS